MLMMQHFHDSGGRVKQVNVEQGDDAALSHRP